MDADQHFSGANFWNGDGFQADVVYAAVNRRLHGRGDRVRVSFDRKLSGVLSSQAHYDILDDAVREIASKRGMGVPDGNGGGVRRRCFILTKYMGTGIMLGYED
jgi:hypothetical protein